MNTKEALVVIDMQPAFSATKKVLRPVVNEVKRAIRQETPILLVELHNGIDNFGTTHENIAKLVEDYPHAKFVSKPRNDGSSQIARALDETWGLGGEVSLQVCGVNTRACVRETVEGLRMEGYDITVLAEACADGNDRGNHEYQINRWKETGHVKVA